MKKNSFNSLLLVFVRKNDVIYMQKSFLILQKEMGIKWMLKLFMMPIFIRTIKISYRILKEGPNL